MYTKTNLQKAPIADVREIAMKLKVENSDTLTKPELIKLILKVDKENEDKLKLPAVGKNDLQAYLNGKLLMQFNTTGKDTTTIERFFARFGGLATSTKDKLILKIGGQEIDYFQIRSKINKLIATNFLQFTAHARWDSEAKKYVNENDESVREAVKFIRKGLAMSYGTINNFLTMDVADFRTALSKDEVFAEYINSAIAEPETKKLLQWEA